MGIISIVVGVIALIICLFAPIATVVLGVIGFIIGGIYKNKNKKSATIGIILSIISIIVAIIIIAFSLKPEEGTITHTKSDIFSEITYNYAEVIKNELISKDNSDDISVIDCSENASELITEEFKEVKELSDGDFYFFVTTNEKTLSRTHGSFDDSLAVQAAYQTTFLVDNIERSPWEKADLYGWFHWKKENGKITKYYMAFTDTLGHGIAKEIEISEITKESVQTKKAKADVDSIINVLNSKEKTYYCHWGA